MKRPEIDHLILDLLEGGITADGFHAIESELRVNREARFLYGQYVRQHSALHLKASGHSAVQVKDVIPMDRVIARQKRRALRIAAFSAAAAIVVATATSFFITLPEAPLARFKVSPNTEYSLTHAAPEGDDQPEGRVVDVGSRMRIEQGTVELAFASGVKGIVHGPADFSLREEGLVDLHRGVAWFEVPPPAVGFQVDTPDFLLTDLGTEFGIVSRQGQTDEVHVFSGEVEVRHHRGLYATVAVAGGEARSAKASGDWKEIAFAPEKFFTELPTWDPAPPYLYWSFDESHGDRYPPEGTHPAADSIKSERGFVDEGPEAVVGRVGNALRFDESRDHIKTDWPGISGTAARSVALWVKLPEIDGAPYNSSLVSWGTPAPAQGKVWSLRVSNLDTVIREAERGRTCLQLWYSGSWINGTTDLADGKWHHVAICLNGVRDRNGLPAVDLYVDGRREQTYFDSHPGVSPPGFTDTSDPNAIPLLIGRSKGSPEKSCNATIDEVFIFDGYAGQNIIEMLANPMQGRLP